MNEILSINQEKCIEELTCPICLDIFQDPIMELPNQHIVCSKCLNNYNKNNTKKICPFCKAEIQQIITPRCILNMLTAVEMKCLSDFQNQKCDWKGNAIDYYAHLKKCDIFTNQKKDELKNVCNKMREALGKEITPHLKSEHLEIFNAHVKEWDWLENDPRDWKWWWWDNNPWWNNKPCIECNNLWHKYDDEIIGYENLRIDKLKYLENK